MYHNLLSIVIKNSHTSCRIYVACTETKHSLKTKLMKNLL